MEQVVGRSTTDPGRRISCEMWSDVSALGPSVFLMLSQNLGALGIMLDTTKSWAFWTSGESRFNLKDADPNKIAEQIANAVVRTS